MSEDVRKEKLCTKCKIIKPSTEFNRRNGRLKSWCKSCNSLRNMTGQYGISIEDYYRMLDEQKGNCLLCGQHESIINRRNCKHRGLVIDHCHTTGKIRGLLCHKCNVGLGNFDDDINRFKAAIRYLEQ